MSNLRSENEIASGGWNAGRIPVQCMNPIRRITAVILAVVCVLSLTVFVFAQENGKPSEPEIPATSSGMTHSEFLHKLCRSYLDQRFERYTSVPQYFQQDYAHVQYGGPGCTIANTGCGITTLAMLATYMTDQEQLPSTMAELFWRYASPQGTAFVLFDDSPAVLGYYLEGRAYYWSDVETALNNGQMVVCLQKAGRFTSSGHFLVLTGITDEGRVMIMDCNVFNHQGHSRFYDGYENGFYVQDLTQNAGVYWIYEKKVVRTATCANCGDGETEGIPTEMFQQDYFCPKCRIKFHKQEIYQQLCHPALETSELK